MRLLKYRRVLVCFTSGIPGLVQLVPEANKYGGLSDETARSEDTCHGRCGTINISCSNALRVEIFQPFNSIDDVSI
jgi:hypothetical protein